jgi:hypothetical protein
MAVAAMCACNAVPVPQVHADTGRYGFFACVQVNEAGDFASRKLDVQALFKFADRPHDPPSPEQRSLFDWEGEIRLSR